MSNARRKSGFVICPIGQEDSSTRKRSDLVLRHIIEPALDECNYSSVRADQIAVPGLVTSQVIQHLLMSDLVIADLSDYNPNVFYELAVRHAAKRPVISMIESSQSLPFDVAMSRTIRFDYRDLDSASAAKREIVRQIKAIEDADPKATDNPIHLVLKALSEHSEETVTAPYQKDSVYRLDFSGIDLDDTAVPGTFLYNVPMPENPLGAVFAHTPGQGDSCIFLTRKTPTAIFGRGSSPTAIFVGRIDRGMSEYHFTVSFVPASPENSKQSKWVAKDLGSTNGTWINGIEMAKEIDIELSHGDVIEAGQSRFSVVFFQL